MRSEGVLALWKGSLPAFLISLPYSTVLFASYHLLRPAVQPGRIDAEVACKIFASGAASGVLLTIFHGPLEMWKVRLQTSYLPAAEHAFRGRGGMHAGKGSPSVLQQLMEARAKHGVQSLFRGSSMLVLRNVPGNGIFFSAFEGFGALFEQNRRKWGLDPFMAQLCVGGVCAYIRACVRVDERT